MVLTCWISDEELQGRPQAMRDFYINDLLEAEGFNLDRMVLSGRSKKRGASWFAQKRYQHEAVDAREIAGPIEHLQGEDEL